MAKVITTGQLEDCLDRIADYFVATNADMTGATAQAAGAKGMAPAPSAGDNVKFLRGDGTWASVQVTTVNHYVDVYNTTTGEYDLPVPAVTI